MAKVTIRAGGRTLTAGGKGGGGATVHSNGTVAGIKRGGSSSSAYIRTGSKANATSRSSSNKNRTGSTRPGSRSTQTANNSTRSRRQQGGNNASSGSDRNEARVRLAEILVRGGYNLWKVCDAIEYPYCTGFNWHSVERVGDEHPNVIGAKPDDDFRLSYRRMEVKDAQGDPIVLPGANLRRQAKDYTRATYRLNETTSKPHKEGEMNMQKILFVGLTQLVVETFDGWASQWRSVPWRFEFTFSDGSTRATYGGNYNSGDSEGVNYPLPDNYWDTGPHLNNYYENGDCVVPPAEGWRYPDFFKV